MILEQTHANRWIVRDERTAIARITRIDNNPQPLYRAELLDPLDPLEHIMLRDSNTLEHALERVTAHHNRLPAPADNYGENVA